MDRVNSAGDTRPRPGSHIDYRQLYSLQDRILDTVFSTESEFYLTGGTCISRFYKANRYSDDLDFFTHQSPRFAFAIRNIVSELRKTFTVNTEIETNNTLFFKPRIQRVKQGTPFGGPAGGNTDDHGLLIKPLSKCGCEAIAKIASLIAIKVPS